MSLTLERLKPQPTPGEWLLLQRRRRRQSQPEAARRYRVTRDVYQRWERGLDDGPAVAPFPLRDYEVCMLLRRRKGWNELEMGGKVGLSRQWVSMIERGSAPPDTLVAYWVRHAPRA
jgi:transcriptional regulator with XRE-family HTH domain